MPCYIVTALRIILAEVPALTVLKIIAVVLLDWWLVACYGFGGSG
jgi:hypothetical protein